MSNHIDKDDPKRWFIAKEVADTEESLKVFGTIGPINTTTLETGLPVLLTYDTELQLQSAVDTIAGSETYYQDCVETENPKFQGESGIYEWGLRSEEE